MHTSPNSGAYTFVPVTPNTASSTVWLAVSLLASMLSPGALGGGGLGNPVTVLGAAGLDRVLAEGVQEGPVVLEVYTNGVSCVVLLVVVLAAEVVKLEFGQPEGRTGPQMICVWQTGAWSGEACMRSCTFARVRHRYKMHDHCVLV